MACLFKKLAIILTLTVFAGQGRAFSLLGPHEDWMDRQRGYEFPGDIGGPMNIGEEYRWNIPVLTYGFDESFLNFFGMRGVEEVEKAFAILNALPPASQIHLDDYPMLSLRFNYRAQANSIYDLKSSVLSILLEEMGLAQPERFVWTLRNRITLSNPGRTNYFVIQRNFEPVGGGPDGYEPSSYINGRLYTYGTIADYDNPNEAFPVVQLVDPLAVPFDSTVANSGQLIPYGAGAFYRGLTRDDVSGLRYLLRPDNIQYEILPDDVREIVTNYNAPTILETQDLAELAEFTRTNSPAAVASRFPELLILQTNSYFTNLVVTNNYLYLTNEPFDPVGTPPHYAVFEVVVTNIAIYYNYVFGNVVTNTYYTNGEVTIQQRLLGWYPWDPVGMPAHDITISETVSSNYVHGTYYVLPTNVLGYEFVGPPVMYTNTVINYVDVGSYFSVEGTNILVGGTNSLVQSNEFAFVRVVTNYNYPAYPVQVTTPFLGTGAGGRRPGVDKITFLPCLNDPLLGYAYWSNRLGADFWATNGWITNLWWTGSISSNHWEPPMGLMWQGIVLSNDVPVSQKLIREISRPDFLFTAEDLGVYADSGSPVPATRTVADGVWINNDSLNGNVSLAGPGVIPPSVTIGYNKIGAVYYNTIQGNNEWLSEDGVPLHWVWGSFDGTTNSPVVYPFGRSVADLEQAVWSSP